MVAIAAMPRAMRATARTILASVSLAMGAFVSPTSLEVGNDSLDVTDKAFSVIINGT
jgi:hypothetical protein